VIDDNKIIIRESFLSGSAEVKPEFLPLLQKTAEILVAGQDTVQVIGHTDSNKIKNFRFHDNWELSKARAKHVADVLMTNGAAPEKVKWAGRAFDEPLEPNDKDSVDARARNRRVEIVVLH
jgi:type VI secretion system protein ImpK